MDQATHNKIVSFIWGIATHIWALSNRTPAQRKGRVQLIDASRWLKPLRKNVCKKIGYGVSSTRHFCKPQPLHTLEESSADILAIEREAVGLRIESITGRQG